MVNCMDAKSGSGGITYVRLREHDAIFLQTSTGTGTTGDVFPQYEQLPPQHTCLRRGPRVGELDDRRDR